MDLYENSENPIIDKKNLSPALLNRLMVINIFDQLEEMNENNFLDLIRVILENEYKGETIDRKIIKLIYENQKVEN